MLVHQLHRLLERLERRDGHDLGARDLRGGRLLGARAQRAHQVEVGDDAPGEPVAGMVAPDDAGDHDAVDRLLGHRAGDGRDVVVRLAVEEPELHGIADPGAAEDLGR